MTLGLGLMALKCVVVGFAGSDLLGMFKGGDEDFPAADLACRGSVGNDFNSRTSFENMG